MVFSFYTLYNTIPFVFLPFSLEFFAWESPPFKVSHFADYLIL